MLAATKEAEPEAEEEEEEEEEEEGKEGEIKVDLLAKGNSSTFFCFSSFLRATRPNYLFLKRPMTIGPLDPLAFVQQC